MSTTMDEEFKRWRARRKSALVMEILLDKTVKGTASDPADIYVERGAKSMLMQDFGEDFGKHDVCLSFRKCF
jgi:hypothetical protein